MSGVSAAGPGRGCAALVLCRIGGGTELWTFSGGTQSIAKCTWTRCFYMDSWTGEFPPNNPKTGSRENSSKIVPSSCCSLCLWKSLSYWTHLLWEQEGILRETVLLEIYWSVYVELMVTENMLFLCQPSLLSSFFFRERTLLVIKDQLQKKYDLMSHFNGT